MSDWGGYVGIVSSAGGLEAVTLLAQNLPKRSGAVYLLAQHMSPTHKSLMGQLIARETDLPVVEIENGMVPEPDTIYVTPPNTNVMVNDGKLELAEPSGHPAAPKPSGDLLLKSIAQNCGEQCVAIILSGTGSDGSYGVQAVREAGGITIAQDPPSAKYDGMPSAAIATGCVDLTLPPEEIGRHLEKILSTPRDTEAFRKLNARTSHLSELLQIVYARTRVNFRDYKENTIYRRITRRMTALGIEEYDSYVEYCRSSQAEVDALFRDFLISVTRFFRDPEQFDQLRTEINELAKKKEDEPWRVWVAGCATGEEAYSVAILLAEALGGPQELRKSRIQIFATDIDTRALETARSGNYPASAANDIPVEYRSRYFVEADDRIEVTPELRSVVLFSQHNIVQDPPFLNLDVASLRNLLIYFNPSLQEKVLSRMHYALAQHGLLFLGTSESVGVLDVLFEGRSKTDKVFGKRNLSRRIASAFDPMEAGVPARMTRRRGVADTVKTDGEQMFEALVRSVAPCGFISTRGGEIVRLIGDITEFTEFTEASSLKLNVRLLRNALGEVAQNLIAVAARSHGKRASHWIAMDRGEKTIEVRLTCFPFRATGSSEETYLLAIDTREPEVTSNESLDQLNEGQRLDYIRRVENEMNSTKEALQQTVEELQTSNEELQSLNEELQSTNEELQATNEELETSNEELQSTNEELITVNEELQINSTELHKVSAELSATFSYAPFPMLMIDEALQVRYASRGAMEFLGIGDLPASGLHLSQCRMPEGLPPATQLCNEALRLREPRSATLQTEDQLLQMVVVPFHGRSVELHGLTMSIVSMDLSVTARLLWQIEKISDIAHWMVDPKEKTVTWSPGVYRIHGVDPDQSPPPLDEAIDCYHPADRDRVRNAVREAIEAGKPFDFQARLVQPDGTVVPVRSLGVAIQDVDGKTFKLVGAFRDMTAMIENELLIEHLSLVQDSFEIGFFSFDITNGRIFWSEKLYDLLGYDPKTHTPSVESGLQMIHPDDRERVEGMLSAAIEDGEDFEYEARLLRQDGAVIRCTCKAATRQTADGAVSHVFGSFCLLGEARPEQKAGAA